MILILCDDDAQVAAVANQQAGNNQFGQAFQFVTHATPLLGVYENLIITAHGVQGEIGNQAGALGWNPAELWSYLEPLFPPNYRGSIYFSVCLGANVNRRVGLSFIEAFRDICAPGLPHSRIYGHFGNTGMQILPPGHRDWREVVRY